MAQTVANYADVMKEVWTSSRLEKQFYDENPLLDRLEKTNRHTIGKQAQVPIHKGRSGGYSVKSSAGGTLNAADEQKVDSAIYTLSYNYQQVSIETGALNQATGGNSSVAAAQELEVTGAISDLRRQVSRQSISNGDALIAKTAAGAADNTVLLDPAGYGYDALVRGWLYSGLLVDIGTTANEVSAADGVEITGITESSTAPALTVGSSVTETATTFVSIKDARAGAVSNEMNGLRNIAGSSTASLGGLSPATPGEEFWKPAVVDTTTNTLTIPFLLSLQRAVHQRAGTKPSLLVTSLDNEARLYSLLQSQVRFSSDSSLAAGNSDTVKWNGMDILALPDVPSKELYMISPDDLLVVTGKFSKPTWMSDIEGAGGGLRWAQGATNFVDAVTYPINLAARRRNTHAAALALTG